MLKLILLCELLIEVVVGGLPSYFPRCSINDPELSDCIVKASEVLRPHIKKGIPELDFPSFNPLHIPKIELQQGSDAFSFKVTLSNISIYGLGDYSFSKFRYTPKDLTFRGIALFDNLNMTSHFDIEGKLLSLPIRGAGDNLVVLGPSSGELNATGILETTNGEEYYKPANVTVNIAVSGVETNFVELFNDNKEMQKIITTFLNENAEELLKTLSPLINEVAEGICMKLLTAVSSSVPYKELFTS